MCAGPFGGSKGNKDSIEAKASSLDGPRDAIRAMGGDPTGMGMLALRDEYERLKKIQDSGGSALPFVPPAPNAAPKMGLRLPRTPVGVSSLKLPRR